jgi:hypothetical protein
MNTENNGYAVYNPNNKPITELPIIYGFNNGGREGWYSGCLIAEDGTGLGGHICSSEGYMLGDLGILEGRREDRHTQFKKHYPNGYRMTFVSYEDVVKDEGLMKAIKLNNDMPPVEEEGQPKVEITVSN